ncbi:ATP-binding protein [Ramlibacter sp. PS3R-8]|uniref:ATP-binding protein n=1 Tax=Ramlibacter sp. PS3R-8 TaxID=3133437 RepID=UPI0030B70B2C
MSAVPPHPATPRTAHAPTDALSRSALFLLGYLALAWVSRDYPMVNLNITPWNPHSALAVGLLVVHPRSWPVVWAAVVIEEAFIGAQRMPHATLLVSTAALSIGYAITAAALRRWPGGQAAIGRRAAVLFLAIAALGSLTSASLRAAALWVMDIVPLSQVAAVIHRGAIGDGVGLVVTLPVLVVLSSARHRAATGAMLRLPEWWLIAIVTAAAVVGVFEQVPQDQFKWFYVLFLPVAWASTRLGAVGAVWSAALVQALLIVEVQTGQYQPPTVFELQALMAALTCTGILLGAIVDERQASEAALRSSLRLAAAGDMAAALAHELNQPLTALSTYARASQMLARRLPETDPAARAILDVTDKLAGEAARAGEIVNRLRRFFRERSTELQASDLRGALEEAVTSQARRAEELRVRLDLGDMPELPPVWIDRVQIAVVLRNLVANAIEAAAERSGADDVTPSVVVSAALQDDAVLVSVVDSGSGLSADRARSVFDAPASSKPGGMGVGLSISRAIVEAHGGRLWGEAGAGGTFRFTLPSGTGEAHDE